jgi:hypothetical protein
MKYTNLYFEENIHVQSININDLTAIYSLDFIHRLYVFQPQRFEEWLSPRHQVNLLWWVRSIDRWSTDRG